MINNETINFINKIVNKSKDEKELVESLNVYKEYLILTEVYSEETLAFIGHMIDKSSEIINIKNTFGSFDVSGIINEGKVKEIQKENKEEKLKVKEKHYSHYITKSNEPCGTTRNTSYCSSSSSSPSSSSSYTSDCGGPRSSFSSCTPYVAPYGSSCGGRSC